MPKKISNRGSQSRASLKTSLKQSMRSLSINNSVRRLLSGDAQSYLTNGRIPRSPSLGEQTFVCRQSVIVPAAITTSVTLPVFLAQAFQLADIDQYAALTSVFDQYKLDYIEAWINPQSSPSYAYVGRFTSVVDWDDDTALTTVGQALDYNNSLTTGGLTGQYRRFRPSCASALYSGTFVSYGNNTDQWIDAASPTVKHYGLKLAFEPTSGGTIAYDLTLTYHVSFKAVR